MSPIRFPRKSLVASRSRDFSAKDLFAEVNAKKSALVCPFTVRHKIYPSWRNRTIVPTDVLSQ